MDQKRRPNKLPKSPAMGPAARVRGLASSGETRGYLHRGSCSHVEGPQHVSASLLG